MQRHDAEIDRLKDADSCAVVLERARPPWALDRRQSSRDCLKYRRGPGEVVIVNHGQRGWWDPGDPRPRGDVFGLVQHLDPGLSFGQARRLLRELAGLAPSFPDARDTRPPAAPRIPAAERWCRRQVPCPGSPGWRYLTEARGLPADILELAVAADLLREGVRGTVWFAHRDHAGHLTGIEMRGPAFRGFSRGDTKSLFRLPAATGRHVSATRLVVTEAPIDVLSLAALEGPRGDSLYVATAGGMGPLTMASLERLIGELAPQPEAELVAATDADPAGERYAEIAGDDGRRRWPVRGSRLRPDDGQGLERRATDERRTTSSLSLIVAGRHPWFAGAMALRAPAALRKPCCTASVSLAEPRRGVRSRKFPQPLIAPGGCPEQPGRGFGWIGHQLFRPAVLHCGWLPGFWSRLPLTERLPCRQKPRRITRSVAASPPCSSIKDQEADESGSLALPGLSSRSSRVRGSLPSRRPP